MVHMGGGCVRRVLGASRRPEARHAVARHHPDVPPFPRVARLPVALLPAGTSTVE